MGFTLMNKFAIAITVVCIGIWSTGFMALMFYPLIRGWEAEYAEPNQAIAIFEFSLIIACLGFLLWVFQRLVRGGFR